MIDIRDRLPPRFFGDSPEGELAAKLLKTILDSSATPVTQIASLMIASFTIQRLLKEAMGMGELDLNLTISEALHLSEQTMINITFKTTEKG